MGVLSGKINERFGDKQISPKKREKTLGDFASGNVAQAKVGRATVSHADAASVYGAGLDYSRELRKLAAEKAKMVVPQEYLPKYRYFLDGEQVASYEEANQPGGRAELQIGEEVREASCSSWYRKINIPLITKDGDRYRFI